MTAHQHKDASMVVQLINEMADKGFSADADTTALVVDDKLVLERLLGFCEGHQGEKANCHSSRFKGEKRDEKSDHK